MSENVSKKWLGKLTKLNAASGNGACRGKAPHKPLLLLCLLDMAEAGELTGRTMTRTAGLVLRFKTYGALVVERWPNRLNLRLPFFHLRTQGFWKAFTIEMNTADSPESCFICELDQEFFDLLGDADFRLKARLLLVSRYFEPRERVALLESLSIYDSRLPISDLKHNSARGDARPTGNAARKGLHALPRKEKGYSLAEAESAGLLLNEEAEAAAKRKGRDARFSVQVVSRYKFTCALTGLCCVTADGATIVDAAHIESWADSGNDEIENGLALCKNAHWMFDEGLWSVRADGRVMLAPQRFTENGPEGLRLAAYAGRFLQFADGVTLRPSQAHFAKHRSCHGFGG